jgi:hypothetical protein
MLTAEQNHTRRHGWSALSGFFPDTAQPLRLAGFTPDDPASRCREVLGPVPGDPAP